ncbi:MAG: hypothetical protein MI861_28115, partial [Pirellulales bacterium]|nr:hypothetical protein [Pirellulales bacterium]
RRILRRTQLARQAKTMRLEARRANVPEKDLNQRLENARQTNHAQIRRELTDKQLKQYSQLCGDPVAFTRTELRFRIALPPKRADKK